MCCCTELLRHDSTYRAVRPDVAVIWSLLLPILHLLNHCCVEITTSNMGIIAHWRSYLCPLNIVATICNIVAILPFNHCWRIFYKSMIRSWKRSLESLPVIDDKFCGVVDWDCFPIYRTQPMRINHWNGIASINTSITAIQFHVWRRGIFQVNRVVLPCRALATDLDRRQKSGGRKESYLCSQILRCEGGWAIFERSCVYSSKNEFNSICTLVEFKVINKRFVSRI